MAIIFSEPLLEIRKIPEPIKRNIIIRNMKKANNLLGGGEGNSLGVTPCSTASFCRF